MNTPELYDLEEGRGASDEAVKLSTIGARSNRPTGQLTGAPRTTVLVHEADRRPS